MNSIAAFGIELSITILGGCLLVLYLLRSLRQVLVDLCGTPERATFWTAFTSVMLVALPVTAALAYRPLPDTADGTFFEITGQLSHNLMTFLIGLTGLGLVVTFFALVAPRAPKERSS